MQNLSSASWTHPLIVPSPPHSTPPLPSPLQALRVAAASTEHQSAEPELNLSLQTAKSLKYPMHDREEIGGVSRPNTAKSAKSAKSGMEDPLSLENAADALDDVQQALADAQDALQKIDPKASAVHALD